jgi:3-dehydroquinate synthase
MANGYVRMIQYGYLRNPELINMLEASEQDISELITTSINCKLELMTRDPFFLSFGQPFSDAIQGHFRFLKYTHGEAVALGMLASSPSERLTALLKRYKLPVSIEGVTSDTLYAERRRFASCMDINIDSSEYKRLVIFRSSQLNRLITRRFLRK